MEAHPASFPQSDAAAVVDKVISQTQAAGTSLAATFAAACDAAGYCSALDFRNALVAGGNLTLSEQEIITLLRRYDTAGDGRINVGELCDIEVSSVSV